MAKLNYYNGDATKPVGTGKKLIIHVCNDIGIWGAGFVLAISKRWKTPEESYLEWRRNGKSFVLGAVQFVTVEQDITVANMISQRSICPDVNNVPPIRYEALETCLNKVKDFALEHKMSVHCPRIGCGLAGGKWAKVENLLEKVLVRNNIDVTVYDL